VIFAHTRCEYHQDFGNLARNSVPIWDWKGARGAIAGSAPAKKVLHFVSDTHFSAGSVFSHFRNGISSIMADCRAQDGLPCLLWPVFDDFRMEGSSATLWQITDFEVALWIEPQLLPTPN
jgi:hypothetical protein